MFSEPHTVYTIQPHTGKQHHSNDHVPASNAAQRLPTSLRCMYMRRNLLSSQIVLLEVSNKCRMQSTVLSWDETMCCRLLLDCCTGEQHETVRTTQSSSSTLHISGTEVVSVLLRKVYVCVLQQMMPTEYETPNLLDRSLRQYCYIISSNKAPYNKLFISTLEHDSLQIWSDAPNTTKYVITKWCMQQTYNISWQHSYMPVMGHNQICHNVMMHAANL